MTKLHQDNQAEPFFISEKMEAELAAAGYEFEPPAHARTESIRELYGWHSDSVETLEEAINRHLTKQGVVS